MKIRKAIIQDVEGIGIVHVDSWRTTYKDIVPDEFLDKLSYKQRTLLWERHLENLTKFILVAENDDGDIIGFSSAGERETAPFPNLIYLETLYLLEAYQGKGLGKLLLKELFLFFQQNNYQTVYVEVLADNTSKYFYEHFGAKLLTSLEINIGGKELEELVYEWDDVTKVIELLLDE
ncbi:N-acetyltransferase family protein [Lysinibacillus fusiformis]|uniref:GNAT family N-acetyltransferase n=1 Tax=Lysinibacillus fusiformis TaxID=28031 RepID=UPI003CFD8688